MNTVERLVESTSPRLGVALRVLKKSWQFDDVLRIIDVVVKKDDVVIDIGANRGVYTARMLNRVGPHGHVHVIEPFPPSVDVLRRVWGSTPNVSIHAVGVSDRLGEAQLRVPLVDGRAVDALATLQPLSAPHGLVPVTLTTLDALLANDGRRIALVKCDVEGHESAVVAGAAQLLQNSTPVLLIEIEQRHQGDGDMTKVIDDIERRGYEGYFVTDGGLRSLSNFRIQEHQVALRPAGSPSTHRPRGYVNNFLFLPVCSSVPTLNRGRSWPFAAPRARW